MNYKSPAVDSWLSSGKWDQREQREAPPLPLSAVVKPELALATAQNDLQIIGSTYSWCSRWSDAQRLQFSSLHLDSESVLEGMPFGVLCWDAVGVSWAAYFGRYLMVRRRLDPERDF